MSDLSNIPRNQLEAIFEDARVVADRLVYLTNLHGGCRDAREVAISILARYEKAYRKPDAAERAAKRIDEIVTSHVDFFPNVATIIIREEIARDNAERDARTCPCQIFPNEACEPSCSCARSHMSGGCSRCCRLGSVEQRTAVARSIIERDARDREREEAVKELLQSHGIALGKCRLAVDRINRAFGWDR